MADGSVKIDIIAEDSGAEKKLDDLEESAKEASGELDNLKSSGDGASDGLNAASVAAGSLAADGLSSLIGSLGEAVSGLFELADETRAFRDDMAKLEAAFADGGHSSETAREAYKGFYKILGESDRSVEAVNHLAELTKSEEEVAQWTDIAAGVTAKFGDSLPLEGLTEAANETAKVGQVTGPLADALNWAGISEDEFNLRLAECNDEQERASLITNALTGEYAAAAEEYNRLTAGTQEAREATASMERAQADLGAAIEPMTTAWTRLKAEAFEALLPVCGALSGVFSEISGLMEENPVKAELIKGALIGVTAAFGVLAVAMSIGPLINIVTAAFSALNLTMLSNPIMLITAAVAALVAAFVYLWNNCEEFRAFWLGLWDGIKAAAFTAWEAISGFFVGAWEKIKGVFVGWKNYFQGLFDQIGEVFGSIGGKFLTIGKNIVEGLKNGVKNAWSGLKSWFSGLFDDLIGIAKKILGIKSPSKKFAYIGDMTGEGYGVGLKNSMDGVENDLERGLEGMQGRLRATVMAENARYGRSVGGSDTGFGELARAVGLQTAGINSLAGEYRRGTGTTRPVIIQLDKRELGRAVVDVGRAEEARTGAKLSLGGAY